MHVLAQINSAPVGSWLALHLNMCRPGVQELGAGAMDTTDQLLWVQPDDVLLVFSIRRYASGPAKVAQHFRDAGPRCWRLPTARPHRGDAGAPPSAVHTSNASPFDSYTAAFFLCNALVSAVAQLRHGAVPQVLARRDTCGTSLNHSACWIFPPAAVPVRAANQQTKVAPARHALTARRQKKAPEGAFE